MKRAHAVADHVQTTSSLCKKRDIDLLLFIMHVHFGLRTVDGVAKPLFSLSDSAAADGPARNACVRRVTSDWRPRIRAPIALCLSYVDAAYLARENCMQRMHARTALVAASETTMCWQPLPARLSGTESCTSASSLASLSALR